MFGRLASPTCPGFFLFRGPLLRADALEFFGSLGFFRGLLYRHELAGVLASLGPAVAPPSFVFTCERFFTAPFLALSPTGLLTATFILRTPSAVSSICSLISIFRSSREKGRDRLVIGCEPTQVLHDRPRHASLTLHPNRLQLPPRLPNQYVLVSCHFSRPISASSFRCSFSGLPFPR